MTTPVGHSGLWNAPQGETFREDNIAGPRLGTIHDAACAVLCEPDGLSQCAATPQMVELLLGQPELQGCFLYLLDSLK